MLVATCCSHGASGSLLLHATRWGGGQGKESRRQPHPCEDLKEQVGIDMAGPDIVLSYLEI